MSDFIPYSRQSINQHDIDAVVNVLKSERLTQGKEVVAFERDLAHYVGALYAVAVSSGTAALHLAYLAAGFKKDDEIITTAHTFAATSNMLLAVGAKPIFCDIRLDTYNIDETKIEKLIIKKTRAIVPVHFAGYPAAIDIISKIARKHKLLFIEDASHALGARYKNKKIGTIGDMTTFSFHPVKNITTGEGGAITTNNKQLYEKLLLYRNHGIERDETGQNKMVELGFNYRITDIQCALGTSQLKRVNSFQKKRQVIANRYYKELGKMSEVILPAQPSRGVHAWHLFVIRVQQRDKIFSALLKAGIGVQIHHTLPVYKHMYYQKNGYKKSKCKNTEEYYKTCVSLPIYPDLTQKGQNYVIETLKKLLDQK